MPRRPASASILLLAGKSISLAASAWRFIIDWPEDWRRYYLSSDLVERDPVIGAPARRHDSFTWAELRLDRELPQASTEALNRIAEADWKDGLVVPIPRGGTRFGLVSLVARNLIDEEGKNRLAPICICFHERVRGMIAQYAFPSQPAGLTPRELECLRLVARGAGDKDIAEDVDRGRHFDRIPNHVATIAGIAALWPGPGLW